MKVEEILILVIPIAILLLITLFLLQKPRVIVKKEIVPYYYRYSHYPNYWDEPRLHAWPVSYPFYYGVGGYSGGYSGGIRTHTGGGSHRGGHYGGGGKGK